MEDIHQTTTGDKIKFGILDPGTLVMSSQLLVRFCGQHFVYLSEGSPDKSVQECLSNFMQSRLGISQEQYWVAKLNDFEADIRLRLMGGKGGFGSQLRAQGNRMSSKKRAGNYEACRDLSGRRIRSVNEAKIVAEYIKRKPELEVRKAEEIREKMEKAILAGTEQKHVFKDVDFLRTAREVVDEVELAVNEALYGDDLGDKEKEKI